MNEVPGYSDLLATFENWVRARRETEASMRETLINPVERQRLAGLEYEALIARADVVRKAEAAAQELLQFRLYQVVAAALKDGSPPDAAA